jgi:3-hydroxyisobutyrate dehydrogenase-like beta-hydroxyacid dehydrogenase
MGFPMAQRLRQVGHEVVIWNRTREKAAGLVRLGAKFVESPADVIAESALVAMCLTSDDAVRKVTFGARGLLSAGPFASKRIIIDCSTCSPELTVDCAARARKQGVGWIDAPVSGGVPAAQDGSLIMFLGGDAEDIATAAPFLSAVSARRSHMGAVGAGQATKICNQMIVAANILVIAETIAAARKAGIDVTRLPDALRQGFADSMPLQLFGPRMAAHSFLPRLGAVAMMEKDLKLALAMIERCCAVAPISKLCAELYARVDDWSDTSRDEDLSTVVGLFEKLK